jgi:exodeoxyribonuclease VII large subunit
MDVTPYALGVPPTAPVDPTLLPDAAQPLGPPPPPGSRADVAVPISGLTEVLKRIVEGAVPALWLKGEVSDFKAHRNGHWYFTLRDQVSQMRCVVWSRDTRGIPAPPDNGMQVRVYARPSVYVARGELQCAVTSMEAEGEGLWQKALERTKLALQQDGLFDPTRKRRLPRAPRRIALITSADGAALQDIRAVVERRNAQVELVVIPCRVQGDGSARSITAALDLFMRWHAVAPTCDLVIIGRGGGAREDLWAFNDEFLCRTVARCPVPIISAVGHEVDTTLCDLVADLRAPTPSAAAESAVPLLSDLRAAVLRMAERIALAASGRLVASQQLWQRLCGALARTASRDLERRRALVATTAATLDALSPLAVLSRGYAVPSAAGQLLRLGRDFVPGEDFSLRVQDAVVTARTEHISPLPFPLPTP